MVLFMLIFIQVYGRSKAKQYLNQIEAYQDIKKRIEMEQTSVILKKILYVGAQVLQQMQRNLTVKSDYFKSSGI